MADAITTADKLVKIGLAVAKQEVFDELGIRQSRASTKMRLTDILLIRAARDEGVNVAEFLDPFNIPPAERSW